MICQTAESTVVFRRMNKNNRPENKEVENLSRQRKEIRLKINNCKVMKAERNRILRQIKKKLVELKEASLDEKIKEINEKCISISIKNLHNRD